MTPSAGSNAQQGRSLRPRASDGSIAKEYGRVTEPDYKPDSIVEDFERQLADESSERIAMVTPEQETEPIVARTAFDRRLEEVKAEYDSVLKESHADYRRDVGDLERKRDEGVRREQRILDFLIQSAKEQYRASLKAIFNDFRDSRERVRSHLLQELDDRRRKLEEERSAREGLVDRMMTRKMRRRNEPSDEPESSEAQKARMQMSYTLTEDETTSDLQAIEKSIKQEKSTPASVYAVDGQLLYKNEAFRKDEWVLLYSSSTNRSRKVRIVTIADSNVIICNHDGNKQRLRFAQLRNNVFTLHRCPT